MKRFQKKVENFICISCKEEIKGTGYTDHCPYCLHSLHKDVNPGDRSESCCGEMVPIGAKKQKEKYIIYYQCLKCNYKHRVKASTEDNIEKIILLTTRIINNDKKRTTKKKNRGNT